MFLFYFYLDRIPGRFRYDRDSGNEEEEDDEDEELYQYRLHRTLCGSNLNQNEEDENESKKTQNNNNNPRINKYTNEEEEDLSQNKYVASVSSTSNFHSKYETYRLECSRLMSNDAYEPDTVEGIRAEVSSNSDLRNLLRSKTQSTSDLASAEPYDPCFPSFDNEIKFSKKNSFNKLESERSVFYSTNKTQQPSVPQSIYINREFFKKKNHQVDQFSMFISNNNNYNRMNDTNNNLFNEKNYRRKYNNNYNISNNNNSYLKYYNKKNYNEATNFTQDYECNKEATNNLFYDEEANDTKKENEAEEEQDEDNDLDTGKKIKSAVVVVIKPLQSSDNTSSTDRNWQKKYLKFLI